MLKKDWKKNLLRVKQIADQNLGRAEKSEVLSEDQLTLEKRVDLIRQVCHTTHKRLSACIQTSGPDHDKRMKKLPESLLASSMLESASQLMIGTLLGQMFQLCGNTTMSIARDYVQHEMNVESKTLGPMQQLLEGDIPAIVKQRKHLAKLTLDMDSSRSRYTSSVKQNHAGNTSASKTDTLRDEMEEAAHRVEQCRDQLATDMYTFLSRESEYSRMILEMVRSEVEYHKKALDVLERLLPQMEEQIEFASSTPVYGEPLEDHLKRNNRDIAAVIEDCVCTLLTVGIEEEGLFRVAGSASKVKKLKAAFDFGIVEMSDHVRDIHCVAGALKLYLRELPEPLMTFDLYSDWMKAAHLPQDQRLQALWVVLDKLPKPNYNNLRYLIKFLAKLTESQDLNKMSASNVAIVMGPNLMWAPGDGGPSVLNTSIQSSIVEQMILHADWFFPGDIDFHKTGLGMASPRLDGRRSYAPPPPNHHQMVPRVGRPRSTHALNAAFSMTHSTLVAPLSPAQQHERSQSVPPGLTLPRTPPRTAQKTSSYENGDRTSVVGAASLPFKGYTLDEKSSTSSEDSVGASSSHRLRPVKDEVGADSSTIKNGSLHGDLLSESATLGRGFTKRDIVPTTRSTTPPPKPPPPKSVHSDVYNTVFALQSLGPSDGWSDYLTTVRGLLDGHMNKRLSLPTQGGAADVDFSVASSSSPMGGSTNGGGSAPIPAEPPTIMPISIAPVMAPPPQTAAAPMTKAPTPPASLSASQDNLLTAGSPSDSSSGSASPKVPRRPSKKPAPLPPGLPSGEKPAIAEKPSFSQSSMISPSALSDTPGVTVSPPVDRNSSASPLIERPNAPPPAPPVKPEKPEKPEKPAIAEKPSSPNPERPRGPPPERPSVPPPDKPDRPPSFALVERPEKPEKPEKPTTKPSLGTGEGTLNRQGSGRPPRPTPPPPPPPDRRSSLERNLERPAPLAVAEEDGMQHAGPTDTAAARAISEETHL